MTLIELLYCMLAISLGVAFAAPFYNTGNFILSFVCLILGTLFLPGLAYAYHLYRKRAYLGDDWMPRCSSGGFDYKAQNDGKTFALVCQKCQQHYRKRRDKVFALNKNGEEKFFKKLEKCKGWI
jgi:hypothetical protein